jgi:DNA-directed RNA polymerase subunit RPC12/RpoP
MPKLWASGEMMTTYLKCKKCGFGFALSTIEYMAAESIECPRCGVKEDRKKCHIGMF